VKYASGCVFKNKASASLKRSRRSSLSTAIASLPCARIKLKKFDLRTKHLPPQRQGSRVDCDDSAEESHCAAISSSPGSSVRGPEAMRIIKHQLRHYIAMVKLNFFAIGAFINYPFKTARAVPQVTGMRLMPSILRGSVHAVVLRCLIALSSLVDGMDSFSNRIWLNQRKDASDCICTGQSASMNF